MASDSALPPVIGAIADDRDGNPLGTITAVFLDDVTNRPTWVGVTDGLHAAPGDLPVIAPIADAEFADGRLRLTVPTDAVRSAPPVSQPDRLSPAEEADLLAHYTAASGPSGHRTDTISIPTTTAGTETATATAPADDAVVTRSEEQLQVTTVVEPWTRAVLRIEEVTEEVLVPVTVTRQQARIEYLPLGPSAAGATGEPAAPGTQRATSTTEWVTLYAEQPSVTLQRVPAERVRLSTTWATEETTVSQELRREQVELTTAEAPQR